MKRAVVMIFFVGALALSVVAQDANYSDCGTPAGPIPEKKLTQKDLTQMCSMFHANAPGLVGTAYCLGQECFKEQNSEHISVVAEKSGNFPRTWFAWVKQGELDNTKYCNKEKCDFCALPGAKSGERVRIEIPLTNSNPNRCKAERVVGKYLYHEHFASNSASDRRCLIWLECREDLPASTP